MEPLEPYYIRLPRETREKQSLPRRVARCPVCGKLNTLKYTQGMILCTHCCWALTVKQAG